MEDFAVYTVGLTSGIVIDQTPLYVALAVALLGSAGMNVAFVVRELVGTVRLARKFSRNWR